MEMEDTATLGRIGKLILAGLALMILLIILSTYIN